LIRIEEITNPEHPLIPEFLNIMWETQGINVGTLEGVKFSAESPKSLLLFAFFNDQLIGGAIAKVLDKDLEYYRPFSEDVYQKIMHSSTGSLSMMGLLPEFQGRGFGQILARQRLEWLRSQGCNVFVGISWVSGLAHTSNRVFEKMGFKAINQIDNFFAESSVEMNLICPVCGEPPCNCPGILYFKED
jgi:GNAT superfamily N-acetyltransferase